MTKTAVLVFSVWLSAGLVLGQQNQTSSVGPKPLRKIDHVAVEKQAMHSSAALVIHLNKGCDLDNGVETATPAGADFRWVGYLLLPLNGAKFHVFGKMNDAQFDKINYAFLKSFSLPGLGWYSTHSIQANKLPVGAAVGYITNEGRLGCLHVDGIGNDLSLSCWTYEK